MAKPHKTSDQVKAKILAKHGITMDEVMECFMNRSGPYFRDTRERHDTDPPSYWFVAETDRRREVKVVFVNYPDYLAIKTAFEPTDGSDEDYKTLCAKYAKLEE